MATAVRQSPSGRPVYKMTTSANSVDHTSALIRAAADPAPTVLRPLPAVDVRRRTLECPKDYERLEDEAFPRTALEAALAWLESVASRPDDVTVALRDYAQHPAGEATSHDVVQLQHLCRAAPIIFDEMHSATGKVLATLRRTHAEASAARDAAAADSRGGVKALNAAYAPLSDSPAARRAAHTASPGGSGGSLKSIASVVTEAAGMLYRSARSTVSTGVLLLRMEAHSRTIESNLEGAVEGPTSEALSARLARRLSELQRAVNEERAVLAGQRTLIAALDDEIRSLEAIDVARVSLRSSLIQSASSREGENPADRGVQQTDTARDATDGNSKLRERAVAETQAVRFQKLVAVAETHRRLVKLLCRTVINTHYRIVTAAAAPAPAAAASKKSNQDSDANREAVVVTESVNQLVRRVGDLVAAYDRVLMLQASRETTHRTNDRPPQSQSDNTTPARPGNARDSGIVMSPPSSLRRSSAALQDDDADGDEGAVARTDAECEAAWLAHATDTLFSDDGMVVFVDNAAFEEAARSTGAGGSTATTTLSDGQQRTGAPMTRPRSKTFHERCRALRMTRDDQGEVHITVSHTTSTTVLTGSSTADAPPLRTTVPVSTVVSLSDPMDVVIAGRRCVGATIVFTTPTDGSTSMLQVAFPSGLNHRAFHQAVWHASRGLIFDL